MAPEERRDIFISYKNDYIGNLFASRLRDNLTAMGYSVYYNPHEKLSPDFTARLREAVRACTDLVLVVSPDCLKQLMAFEQTDWVREEILTAREAGKHIVPLMVGGAAFPQDWNDLPEPLRFLPSIDHLVFPQEPEEYYQAPFTRLTNNLRSQRNTGGSYRDVIAGNPDFDARADLQRMRAQAAAGDIAAMYELAMTCYYGIASDAPNAVRRDYVEACRWLKQVAAADHPLAPHAKNLLAHLYYCGEVPMEGQSYEMAYRLHREASAVNTDSAVNRAFQERIGCGCEYDFQRMIDYYEEIIGKGDNLARLELARLYTTHGLFDRARELYEAMDVLSPEAAYELGMLYKRGQLSDPPRPEHLQALYYLSLAKDVMPQAALELGMIYFRPSGRVVRRDFAKAEHCFETAARHGLATAQYMLGFMYEHGYITRDLQKSIDCFQSAADQGNSLAAAELAQLYQLEGPGRDYAKAYRCARQAADQGVAEASFILGNLLFLGRGCKADPMEARHCYETAAAHGIYPAKVMLEKLDRICAAAER